MPRMNTSEYARHRGCDEASVRAAIQRGRITPGADGLIDSEKADVDWAVNTDPRKITRGKDRHTLARDANRALASRTAPEDDLFASPDPTVQTASSMNFASARAAREIFAARLLKVELDQKLATLVDKRSVQLEAQNRGQVLRDAMMNIPNRLAAQLAAEQSPASVHEILESEIRMVLEEFSDGKLG